MVCVNHQRPTSDELGMQRLSYENAVYPRSPYLATLGTKLHSIGIDSGPKPASLTFVPTGQRPCGESFAKRIRTLVRVVSSTA